MRNFTTLHYFTTLPVVALQLNVRITTKARPAIEPRHKDCTLDVGFPRACAGGRWRVCGHSAAWHWSRWSSASIPATLLTRSFALYGGSTDECAVNCTDVLTPRTVSPLCRRPSQRLPAAFDSATPKAAARIQFCRRRRRRTTSRRDGRPVAGHSSDWLATGSGVMTPLSSCRLASQLLGI